MFESVKNWINQNILSNVEEHNSAKIVRTGMHMILDEVGNTVSSLQEGVSPISIKPTTPLTELNTLPNAVYRAFGEGTYQFSPALQIVQGSAVNIIPPGYSVKFLKDASGWSVSVVEKLPAYDDTNLVNRVANVESSNTQFQTNVNQRIDDLETEQQDFIENFAVEVDQEFNEVSENAISNKAVSLIHSALFDFLKNSGQDVTTIDTFESDTYIRRDGGTFITNGNKAILNVDTREYTQLRYNCYPAIITSALSSQYCAILGVKNNNELVVIRNSNLIVNSTSAQYLVDEFYDISDYKSISISIADMSVSLNQIPNININKGGVVKNVVKNYIDEQNEEIKNEIQQVSDFVLLNNIESFNSSNTNISGGASYVDNNINIVGNSTIGIIENTLNEKSEMSIIYTEIANADISLGFRSYNNYGYKHNVFVRYVTSGSNAGRLQILANSNLSFSKLSESSNTNYTVGDVLKLGIERIGLTYRFFVQNLTKSWKLEMKQITTPLGTPFVAHNSAFPQIINSAGSAKIFSFKHIYFDTRVINSIIGDSITFGQSASTEQLRWANLVLGDNLVMGGGADVTSSVLSRVSEVIKIKPRRVLLMIGGNDILFGVNTSVWQQNLRDIRNRLTDAGIEVVHCYPTPRNGATQLINFIKSEFITDLKIDTNTELNSGNYDSIKTEYNSGDNLHPNNLGMSKVAEIINRVL